MMSCNDLSCPPAVQVVLTVSKPGEKGDVPVGVIVGSVIAGLLLLALAVGLLWKVRFYLCLLVPSLDFTALYRVND